MKLKSKRFCRSISKLGIGNKVVASPNIVEDCSEIKWELRPGGMLVQKRESKKSEEIITIRVSTLSKWHDISIEATSTFGKSNPTPLPFSFANDFSFGYKPQFLRVMLFSHLLFLRNIWKWLKNPTVVNYHWFSVLKSVIVNYFWCFFDHFYVFLRNNRFENINFHCLMR